MIGVYALMAFLIVSFVWIFSGFFTKKNMEITANAKIDNKINDYNLKLITYSQIMGGASTEDRIKNPLVVLFALESRLIDRGNLLSEQNEFIFVRFVHEALKANSDFAPLNFEVPIGNECFFEDGRIKAESFFSEDWKFFIKTSIEESLKKIK